MFLTSYFDASRDVCPCVSGLAIDLNIAIENKVVFDTGTVPESNGIEDVHSVTSRVRNAFDALDKKLAFAKSFKAVADAVAKTSPNSAQPAQGAAD